MQHRGYEMGIDIFHSEHYCIHKNFREAGLL